MTRVFQLCLCAMALAAATLCAQQYQTEDAFAGLRFEQPLGIATAPGELSSVYVLEKAGRIQVVRMGSGAPTKSLFLDLTPRPLYTDSEGGLLGLAFHPQFATNRFFYVFYTLITSTPAGTGLHDRLSRFTLVSTPGATNADILATEVPLFTQFDEAGNHNGGDLHFGPDGYLYVALGDEGGGNDQFNNSQRIDRDFFAGLLRIDVDRRAGSLAPNPHPAINAGTYNVPPDNPFVGATTFGGANVNPSQVRTEFWAVGLRNPWRFSFDPANGRLFLGDVGQSAREEINLITRGGNYGWSYREGLAAGPRGSPPAGVTLIDPIWDAERTLAASITGGVVYRGNRFPALAGRYVFGDFVRGRIFGMTIPASGPVQVETLVAEANVAGFGVDPQNGDVLVANLGAGIIKRLVQAGLPVISVQPGNQTVTAGRDVSFSAGGSGSSQRWQISTDGGTTWQDLSDNTTYSGTTAGTLTVTNAGSGLNGNRYRLVSTNAAGTATSNGALLTVAPLVFPSPGGVDLDPAGNLVVTDATDSTINRVASNGVVSVIAGSKGQTGIINGNGGAARFNQPTGVAVAVDGVIYVADSANALIRRIALDGTVTTLAGSFDSRGSQDGMGTAATFSNPQGMALAPDGNVYVADAGSHTVRRVTPFAQVTTVAGGGGAAGSADGVALTARFNRPSGVAADSAGNLYVTDTFNNTIRRIATNGIVTTLAGVPGVAGYQDGTGTSALFSQPSGIAVDATGNIYVADEGNHVIRRVTAAGSVTTLAGLPSIGGKKDASGTNAWFNHPRSLSVDSAGNVIVADVGNATLRRISPQGDVTTVSLTTAASPPPTPTPTPTPTPAPTPSPGGGGGGGGAVSVWFLAALCAAAWWRRRGMTLS